MPDFFQEPGAADIAWYPPDTEEKQGKLGKWFENAAPPKHLPKVPAILDDAEKTNPKIKSWGCIGYCKFSHYSLPSHMTAVQLELLDSC